MAAAETASTGFAVALAALNATAAAAGAADDRAAKDDGFVSERDEFLDEVEDESELEADDYDDA
mgnify:CR=1 FL=1